MGDIGKCICQFCVCGRHRCPRNRGSLGYDQASRDGSTISEYTQKYDARPYQPPRPSLRPLKMDNDAHTPMDGKSTYTATYLKHKAMDPSKPFRPRYVPLGSGQATGTDTTYREDYIPKNGKRAEPYRPEGHHARSSAKVDQDSEYRVTFREPSLDERARCRPAPIRRKECIENFGSGPTAFDSSSVMKNDFRQHDKPERARLHRPQPETQVDAGPFETNTSYSKDFGHKQGSPVHAIRPKEYQAPAARFEGTSTAKSDFTPHPGFHREPAFRPPVNHEPKTAFDGATTSKEAYRQWPTKKMEKPTWAKRKAYEPTPNDNVYSSSYQSDFMQPKHFERAHLMKPVPQDYDLLHGPNNTNIPKVTHYREQFTPFTIKSHTKSFKMNQVYEPPTERFMAQSVYKSNYTGDQVPHGQAAKPRQRRSSDETPHSIDFHTTYKETFKAERPASCPAKELLTASEEYGHIGFRNGHSYYKQKSPRRCKTPKDMDPLFPATPESQKTDRERSSSRPPSATRQAEQARSTSAGRRSRPTTPRARPTSANKDSSHTSPRKAPTPTAADCRRSTTPRNTNNHNATAKGKAADNKAAKGSSSPRKTEVKSANRNNSNANTGKAVPKPASPDKKPAPKTDTKTKDSKKEAIPPPIRRPKKDVSPAVDPAGVPKTYYGHGGAPQASHAGVPKTSPGDVPKPAESNQKPVPTPSTTSSLPKTPAATSITTIPGANTTTTTTMAPASNAATAKTTAAPSVPAAPTTTTTTSLPPTTTASTAATVPKPVEKPSPVTPMSTTAPPAPTTGSDPLVADVPMSTPLPVEPPMIRPISAATAASAPPSAFAPLPPATLVSAPAAPSPTKPLAADLDLSSFDTPQAANAEPWPAEKEPEVDTGPKMPVIAPPPAPAQPVVRMGNGPREADLMQ